MSITKQPFDWPNMCIWSKAKVERFLAEHLRQKRKAAKDQQNTRIAQLEQRLAQLEQQAAAEARWRP